ncbi:MAG: superfamily protein [Mucilaginibacter sp.]|nr:superfamily protein [Mucilaginibacter sp.]
MNALIFVLTDIAEADARIAIWDAKYDYLFWRPVTSLNADEDGGISNNYAKWTPLIATPPHPSYPCGHCGTVQAGFDVLKKFYGDKNTIELHTTTPGEPVRTIKSLSDGESENSWSRIYGGIHYPFDNAASTKLGKQVADYVLANGPKRK